MNKFIFIALMLFGSAHATMTPDLDFVAPEGVTGEPLIVTYRVVGKIVAVGPNGVSVKRNNCKDHLNSPDNPLVRWAVTVQYGGLEIDSCYYAKRPNAKAPDIGDRFEVIIKSYVFPGMQLD